jgi:hypothetical protein
VSLIDEALKRAQAADRLSAPPSSAAAPIHLPERRPRRLAGFVIAAALAVAGAGVWYGVHRRREIAPRHPSPARAIPAPAIPATAPPSVPTGIPDAAARVIAPASTPVARPLVERAPQEAPTAAPRTAAHGPAKESEAPRSLVDGKTYSGEVLLAGGAKITLDGIVYSDDNPVALINGLVLAPGTTIEGMTIARIEADRVVLEGRGVTISLAVK